MLKRAIVGAAHTVLGLASPVCTTPYGDINSMVRANVPAGSCSLKRRMEITQKES
jgi:hypothetical protein